MKKYIIILAAILTVASCAPKEEMGVTQQTDKMRFTAIHEGAVATKTYLSSEEDGMYPVYWSEGDKIKIIVSQHESSDGQGYQLDLESGEGTVEAVFSGSVPELPDGSLYYYAVYPYSLAASIGPADLIWEPGDCNGESTWDPGDGDGVWELSHYLEIPLPSVQQYAPHSFGRDYNPAIAVSRDQTLRFKNACGLLRINLTGNVTVGKIVVEGDGDAPLWGSLFARFRWRQNSPVTEFLSFVWNQRASFPYGYGNHIIADNKRITLDCGDGVALSDVVTDFYIALPIQSANSAWVGDNPVKSLLEEGFTLRVYGTDGTELFAKHTGRDNTIHRSMIRNMPVVDIRRQTLTDLSSNGAANSYMVSPDGGTYRFYAGTKGNGPLPVSDSPAVLAGSEAVILWETLMSNSVAPQLHSVVKNVSYNPATQCISFSSTTNPGNALIALKDADDNILWSWHIWSTDYNPDTTYDTYGTAILMDRNLGALRKDAGDNSFYGLYYQWGRKDPFDANYDPSRRKFLFFPSNPFGKEDYQRTTDEIAAHPTMYYGSGTGYHLYEDKCHGLMSAADYAESWGKDKTIYDPCPPGWQVADLDAFYQYSQSITGVLDFTQYDGYAAFNSSTPAAIYPVDQSLWTNYHHKTREGSISIQPQSSGFALYEWSAVPDHVRCQRSNTVVDSRPVIDLSASGTANCYMARPRNKYKFNASVKGNSGISTGMPANAAVSVMTENSTEITIDEAYGHLGEKGMIMDCYLKDGYIYFTTSLDPVYGNATIVLKDPHDRILWSWHIWIVDYNPDSDYDTVDWGEAGNKKFMKMNLGALNNTKYDGRAMGLTYQWGRKDPYMGAVAYDSNSPFYCSGEYGIVEPSASTSTLAYAIRHPGYAILDEAGGDGDWLDEHENALWGEEKTIFDPCPPGWKVPSRPIYNSHSVSSQFQYGMQMDGIWYPANGFRHPVSFNLNNVGLEGHYWYSTAKDDCHAYSFFFDSDNETVDLANHYSAKAQANAVRCMKDE